MKRKAKVEAQTLKQKPARLRKRGVKMLKIKPMNRAVNTKLNEKLLAQYEVELQKWAVIIKKVTNQMWWSCRIQAENAKA